MSGGLDPILSRFERERTWLLPALHAVQHAEGYLSERALAEVAAYLRVPASEVYGVATHYPELRLLPRGRHHIRVCTGVSCALGGGRALLAACAKHYDAEPGALAAGREVTLEPADCFFACSVAPLIEVDGTLHGRASLDGVSSLLASRGPSVHPHHEPLALTRDGVGAAGSAAEYLQALVDRAAADRAANASPRIVVQAGTCGRAVGAQSILDVIRQAVRSRGVAVAVIDGGCNGMCYAAPVVEYQTSAERLVAERVTSERAERLVTALADRAPLDRLGFGALAAHPYLARQERVLLARAGAIDPGSLDDALLAGGYAALARALDGPPEGVIERVKGSGLQGRGGAFFPTAVKWQGCRAAAGAPKYVVMNGEEGEPGIFKDRHLMEGDPHQLIEGVLIAAYAAGASRAVLYVHGEADLAAARLDHAVAQAAEAGIVGDRVLGRDVACHVELRRGAGGFVLGEETALLESIEGRRAQPRTRPPFPVESGLWGKPTVINNVETLAAIPWIVARGGEWFAALGTDRAAGTKVFGLSGPIARPGVVEVRNGVTLRTLLEAIGGGAVDGRPLRGALVGGPSGAVVPAALFDEPMEPRGRVSPGTGGVVAVPYDARVVDVVKTLVEFNANESCGKCTPCREGLPRLRALIDELGTEEADARVKALAETIQLASLCGLGQAAPLSLLRALESFPADFRERG